MTKNDIIKKSAEYFSEKYKKHGSTPQGVDWNSDESQEIRFQQVLKIIDRDEAFTLNDIGCGYAALAGYLHQLKGHGRFSYTGYDICAEYIETAQKSPATNIDSFQLKHIQDLSQVEVADFSVASGIFNKKINFSKTDWEKYILSSLDVMDSKSTQGFSFNMLTSYSDVEKMKEDLYYGDPSFFFDYCKRKFSRNVALLHDYEIYDFTILVRKA